ncbi:MAG TPA: hypothetical protein VGX92_07130 [Pyrinomonadaceae bacterium]|jgi:hypothetical protein|nr:hypothetical protein [Pyrinomonadaceae bacterium]
MKKSFRTPFVAVSLVLLLCLPVFADTIRLKDGSIIRGQVVGFKDQQFTVLVGAGARGRRSRITLYMEDVESIEFDAFQNSASGGTGADTSNDDMSVPSTQTARTEPPQTSTRPSTGPGRTPPAQTTTTTTRPPASSASPTFFQINTRVRGDNTTNGWTNSGLVVRRGQRLRISATGRVLIGGGRVSTPAGLAGIPDNEKLMRTEPTGALIAVIGDDNDNFILIGRSREFTAERDGVLFLGVNEGNLNDNTGAYDAVIEAEAISNSQR